MTNHTMRWGAFLRAIDSTLAPLPTPGRTVRPDEQAASDLALSSLIATLAMAVLNKLGTQVGGYHSFNGHSFTGTGISARALPKHRDRLEEGGLAKVVKGYHSHDIWGVSHPTRLIPTPKFRRLFSESGVGWMDIPERPRRLIEVRKKQKALGPEPRIVTDSRATLNRLNANLRAANVELPETAWSDLRARLESAGANEKHLWEWLYMGNTLSRTMRRIFTGHWTSGGRLYGPWWQGIPKDLRRLLTINDQETVELDFAHLHPTLLYAEAGARLEGDAYLVPGYTNVPRDYGKTIFQRLINGKKAKSLWYSADDHNVKGVIESESDFRRYVTAMIERHHAIRQFFGKRKGLNLQYQDSELALSIINDMTISGIVVLPIHDSFRVIRSPRDTLHKSMIRHFFVRYGFLPDIKES